MPFNMTSKGECLMSLTEEGEGPLASLFKGLVFFVEIRCGREDLSHITQKRQGGIKSVFVVYAHELLHTETATEVTWLRLGSIFTLF